MNLGVDKIYLTSDWHFNHDKNFVYGVRGFHNVKEMNEGIIERHNSIVKPDDVVICLGDCGLGGGTETALAQLKEYIEALNGKLIILLGNHDTDTRAAMYQECCNVVYAGLFSTKLNYKKYHFLLSHYPTICSSFDIDKPLKERLINICGHSHILNPFEDWERYNSPIFHCEMETNNCYPWLLDDIIEKMKERVKVR